MSADTRQSTSQTSVETAGSDERAGMRRRQLMRWSVSAALVAVLLAVGGSIFEHAVIDPAWPSNIEVIQPEKGGVDRKIFWIPIHIAITVLMVLALWASWRLPAVRRGVLIALACYVAMRVWSALYFIPEALRYEKAAPLTGESLEAAWTWVFWSPVRSLLLVAAGVALWLAERRSRLPTAIG